ncbi:MAG: flagellar hook-associated protein FlgL [Acidobacteria bacterium]|nr:flagellar hook-associated protein FlgL [Acidobacteriota bacterium]
MRITPNNTATLVSELNRLNAQQANVSAQIASGSRLTSLASDPSAAGQSAQMTGALQSADSFIQTSATVVNRMQAADSALGSVVSSITSAISVAVQGSNVTMSASNLRSIAQQLTGIRDQVLSLANASYQGAYLFAGTSGTSQPFTLQSDGSVTYSGDGNAQQVSTADGVSLATSVSGATVFGSGGPQDVFAVLNSLIQQFASGNITNVADGVATLRTAFDGITSGRSTLDASINRLNSATDATTAQKTSLKVAQTSLLAANTAELATEFSATETQRTALMSVISVVQKGSLFDYL